MPSLDRRGFLRHSFAVATSSYAVPSLLAEFFTTQDPKKPGSPNREELLRIAWQRAGDEGKPLLVLVVPAEPRSYWDRGSTLGALLNHGGPATLLELAMCVVACGTIAEVGRVTGANGLAGEPLMLLVEPAQAASPPEITPIAPELADAPPYPPRKETEEDALHGYKKFVKAEEDWVHDCNARITTALRRSLHDDGNRLADLAERVRRRLPKESLSAIEGWLAGGPIPDDDALLVRCTGIVRESARVKTDQRGSAALDAVAAAADRVLVKRRVPGSKWANDRLGCGQSVELEPGERNESIAGACGMGHVRALSTRFLLFYTGS